MLIIAVCVLMIVLILSIVYIAFIQLQLRNVNQQLDKRLAENTRQPISLELFNRKLNKLAANINRCLKAEENLRLKSIREEKEFKVLIANISHDLRTPLTVIRGYQQLMEKGEISEEQIQKLKISQKHAEELGNLIERFFEYSYIANAELEFKFERINLTNLVTECLAESVVSFEERELRVYFEETVPMLVFADKGILIRIVQNLIRNCLKHSAGDITVRLHTYDTNVVLSFYNPVKNGVEIDTEHIFDRFYTSDKARSIDTGLGLSIVKLLTEQMGGSVNAVMQDDIIEICVGFPMYEEI